MRILALTALATFALDQISKWFVVFHLRLVDLGMIDVWPPWLTFRMAWNRGVNFGLFAHDAEVVRWVLVALALVISGWALWWLARVPQRRLAYVSGGLLVGGALGNVVDRVLYGAVADFLNMSCCGIENPYAFNVADIAIFAGAAGLVLFAADAARGGGKGPKAGKTP
jgi:signal peptidase II